MGADDEGVAGVAGVEGVLEAARAIRPYLPALVGPDASALDGHIAAELEGASGQAAAKRLRELLGTHQDTAWFLDKVLADAPYYRPPQYQPRYRHRGGYPRPAGEVGPVVAGRYTCPHGDYVWYRPDVGTPVPACPTHQVALASA